MEPTAANGVAKERRASSPALRARAPRTGATVQQVPAPRQLPGGHMAEEGAMSKLRCHISISLDGFVAGPSQSEENPLGEGGEGLHDWVVSLAAWRESHDKEGGAVNESSRIVAESRENVGAGVMGRNMFGPPGGGPWGNEDWT